MPVNTVKNLRRRTPGRARPVAWPAPRTHKLRDRKASGKQSPVLRALGALVGSAMIGGVAVAGAVNSGAVPILAPVASEPAAVAAAAPAMEAPVIEAGPALAVQPPGQIAVAQPYSEAEHLIPAAYNPLIMPPPRARHARWGPPAPMPVEPPEADADWIDTVVPDGARYGDTPRLYVFAAGGGQSVGMNYLPYGDGWRRDGWSRDHLALTGDAQAGIGLRRGPVQVSFGYVYRRTRTEVYETLILPKHEDRVAVTVSVKQ